MSRATDAPIAPAIVEQACHWLMLHWDGGLDERQARAFTAWQAADPEHQRAWQRLQHVQGALTGIPKQTLREVLGERPDRGRRDLVKLLGLLLVAGGGGYVAQSRLPWREAMADQRTGTGEIRRVQLADGSRLDLGSGSAVNIRFDTRQRRIRLLAGEILLSSGENSRLDPRPLLVETAAGDVQALGTRFAVREQGGVSHVELYEGELEIRPRSAAAVRIQAGTALWFAEHGVGQTHAANSNRIAWREGRLIAEHQPLGQFLDDLSRHRPGVIRCDATVADLPITGVFPLSDTDRILATLEDILPVEIHYLTRYWVTVKAS